MTQEPTFDITNTETWTEILSLARALHLDLGKGFQIIPTIINRWYKPESEPYKAGFEVHYGAMTEYVEPTREAVMAAAAKMRGNFWNRPDRSTGSFGQPWHEEAE